MVCPKCNNPGVKNQALNKEFYYCRICKDEIVLKENKLIEYNDSSYYEQMYGLYGAKNNPNKSNLPSRFYQVGDKAKLLNDYGIYHKAGTQGVITHKFLNGLMEMSIGYDKIMVYSSEIEPGN